MDQELIAYLDKRFEQIDKRFEQVDKRFEQVDKRFEQITKELGDAVRANGVEIEGLRGQIQQVAEGVATCNQRIDSFQTEVSDQFKELREIFQTSHSNLHRRVGVLESWKDKVERRT